MMKKIISIALVFVLCFSMLVACGNNDAQTDDNKDQGGSTTTTVDGNNDNNDSNDNNNDDQGDNNVEAGLTVDEAKTALIALYQKGSAKEAMEIKATKKVFAMYQGLTVEWTIAVSEGDASSVKIEAIEGNEIEVNLVVPNAPSADVKFTATATIKDNKGNSAVAEFLYVVPGVKIPDPESTLSVKEAAALGASKAHNEYTTGKYYIIATVVEVTDKNYGNMKVKGEDGTTLTIYGSFGPNGEKFVTLDPQPKSGDKVKLYGIIGQYNDNPQMKNANIKEVNSKKPGTVAPTTRPSSNVQEPAANSNVSIADAIEIGLSKEDNVYTKNKYYVTGTVVEVYNEQYGNMKIKDDKNNILTVYGTWSADGKHRYDILKTQAKAGDTIKVYGVIGQYGGVAQVKNGWIIEINGKKPEIDPSKTTTAPKQDVTAVDPVVGKAYKFGMIQELVSTETVYFLKGGMNGYYMDSTYDVKQAIDVYLEEADGGYYMYTMIGGKKTYINMVVSGTHVNGAYEATAKTVYTYDKTAKTIIADIDGRDYWFGTRNDKTYTTIGPCATSYNGFYCMFYEA